MRPRLKMQADTIHIDRKCCYSASSLQTLHMTISHALPLTIHTRTVPHQLQRPAIHGNRVLCEWVQPGISDGRNVPSSRLYLPSFLLIGRRKSGLCGV